MRNERHKEYQRAKNKLAMIFIPLALAIGIGGNIYQDYFEFQDAHETTPAPVRHDAAPTPSAQDSLTAKGHRNDERLRQAFAFSENDLQIDGRGTVDRILPDDLDGSRHQRFILRTGTGQTLLVAHNIDLAPRIPNLRVGDTVEFYGEYEYNDKGGVIHWTHHDPRGRHVGGWLKHNGKTYQ